MMTTLLNNRYQVIEVLGVGGFGETFLAEDVYMPSRRRCVIKQLKPMTNDPKLYPLIQQRFGREAAILEKMGEGNSRIPKLYAYFSENGQFYLVQEWIEGQTVTSIVEAKGRLSETAVRDIVASLLSVLDYVHGEGIIHRDIKPDNIILRHSDGLPILIDFGAVKETIANVSYTQAKIHPSMVLGTPGFMSPEQAAGRPSYSSDLYSLGLTAIYMLTGKLPQQLEIDPQTGQLLWQQYASNVSPSLIAVLDKAVQSHPRDRYSTAKKMLLDLQSDVSIPSVPTTKATVIIPHQSKTSSQPEPIKSPAAVALNKPFNQRNWLHILTLGILASGLLGTIAMVGLVRNQSTDTSNQPIATTTESDAQIMVDQSPAPATPTPAISSPQPHTPIPTPSVTQTPLQTPDTDPTPATSPQLQKAQDTPIPTPSVDQTPLQTPDTTPTPATSPQPQKAQDTPIPTPSVDQTPLQTPDTDPTPATSPQLQTEQNTPIPTPSVTQTPPSEPQNQNNDNIVRNSVPGFPIGTSESRVKAALGNPTQISRGIWGNTRAYVYDIKPNQITLGYLFERNSGQLRQTEVSFAQSVDFDQMQATLQEMLGRDLINVNQGLQRVYQRRDNKYTFNTGELKVTIERNERDRIYIGVWDADLH